MVHVVVCGGGFGGLPAARALRDRLDEGDRVTVIARDDQFFMGFAKLWALAGDRDLEDGTRGLQRLEASGIAFVQAEVTAIDPAARRIETSTETFAADGIVVALGAAPPPVHRDWLAGEDTLDLYDHRNIPHIRERLHGMQEGRVVVAILGGPFKCPPAPYEATLIIDDILRDRGVRDACDITVVTPQPLTVPAAGVDASHFVASHLGERGVEVRTGSAVTGIAHGDGRVELSDGSSLSFDLLLGVPADAPLEPVADSTVSDADGWIRPDPATFRTAFDRVYATGDCTVIPTATGALPHAGVFAASGGVAAATNLAADLRGGRTERFDGYGYCFLELPDQQVAFIEGDFYADPPDVSLTDPSREQYERKLAFERERLEHWLP
ncbi:MAG: FAD/NAD(P)-binding oxidoreductase [Nitriliruptorales bacterium]|nr:FAD/NAD(P)-binding oxidoreductase [Nitriliruptorales bacterium]